MKLKALIAPVFKIPLIYSLTPATNSNGWCTGTLVTSYSTAYNFALPGDSVTSMAKSTPGEFPVEAGKVYAYSAGTYTILNGSSVHCTLNRTNCQVLPSRQFYSKIASAK